MKVWMKEFSNGKVIHYCKPILKWQEYVMHRRLLWDSFEQAYTDNGDPIIWDKFGDNYNKMKEKIDLLTKSNNQGGNTNEP